ncbi:NPCBM/NEW2 domain-containing protein [Verrucomicrobiaceae bacterium N1E253]|uniref:NPCBM/NEW2 domain-containing protein n=1 Tax=Oceaniferula marina TaxID=2748318 RepID=A0A851GCY2_9BACT|nr:PVC-type heme-binding CxxCH protein [Oceaniferula marina]NWK55608.1 NPCBM/NEW2 domain-containing protein [Oceaniferula marina]
MKIHSLLLILFCLSAWHLSAAEKKKIIFIAGADSHAHGAHEFLAGFTLLKNKLEEAMGDQLDIILVENDWPKNENIFKNAAATVIYSDGLKRHPLNNRFQKMDELVSRGMGLAVMHFACDVAPGEKGDMFKKWIGGHYETRFSTNPHWVCDALLNKEHEICSGCKGFKLKDEWYYNMRWSDTLKHTAVLQGIPDEAARSGKTSSPRGAMKHIVDAAGQKETLLWCVERPDGGRGFGFTGGHYHANWQNDEFRKLILNAIVWLAKIKVPKDGVVTKTPTKEEMHFNTKLERKQRKQSNQNKKINSSNALFRSKTLTKDETVDITVDIKGKKNLVLIVDEATGGLNYDHANWINPRLIGPKGELALTKLRWLSADAGYGQVRVAKSSGNTDIELSGRKIRNSIGTHAHSTIVYEIPKGYHTFKATGALSPTSGGKGSVVFEVDDKTPKKILSLPPESFNVEGDLEVTVWAQSPMFYNPTNMDVDAKGRIWVAEGVQYRVFKNKKMDVKHPEGDRIMVLTDTDNDGKADKSHCFVQDKALVAPLGVAVIGNRVIVSQPPSLIMYTDVDGNARFDPAIDKRKSFLTGFSGKDHDHSLHSVTFGPDGEYYFNQGNAGYSEVKDKSGKVIRVGSSYTGGVKNKTGEISDDGFMYVGGFACRAKPDGTGLTVIGHNFRNSYEQTVSSYGDVFQNDNDDPPACRTTWLMEYGNAGFSSADGTRSWKADRRPGQSTQIAEWRQEDPGTLPAGDVYGGGAPTGIAFYENGALGPAYEGLILSAESANREILGYYPAPRGAGFTLENFSFFNSHKKSSKSLWFRPSDVAVGADGAIYVADWFDPAVGGHKMADATGSGTIYRIAPKGFKPHNPEFDLKSIEGMVQALKSPAVNVRALGFIALKDAGAKAVPALKKMLTADNHYFRARATWLLSQINDDGKKAVEALLDSSDVQTRIVAFRALRRERYKFYELCEKLVDDKSPAVRREVALAMRNESFQKSKAILTRIAEQYDGEDRWYLEAFGTGCAKKEQQMYALLRSKIGAPALEWDDRFEGIAWRLHQPAAVADFRKRAMSTQLSLTARKRMLTAMAFADSKAAALAMLEMALVGPEDTKRDASWWVKNKSYSSWKSYNLMAKLKSNEVPKEAFDLSKHLSADNGTLPSIDKLLKLKGNVANGEKLFHGRAICSSCHQLGDKGTDLGPNLTGIGKKFDGSALLDSMINPSSAISFGFETVTVEKKDGTTLSGFLVVDADPLLIKDLGGNDHAIAVKDIKKRENMKNSIMPSVKNLGLQAQDVTDLLEYLKKN